ncbi:hypothetical protein [Rothia sp. P7208]|uniref:hypothetical protein n=1 Tax=Rothia sp. P7208 TaxID=3402660 RepID=UPI003AC4C7BF
MGLFSRRKDKKAAESAVTAQPVEQPVEPKTSVQEQTPKPSVEESASTFSAFQELNEQSALHSLIRMMRSKGEGQLTLDLKQEGNDMLLTFEENGKKIEETIVVPGNSWFENVAALYTEEEEGSRGAWTRALIILLGTNAQVSYLNSKNETSCNLHYRVEEMADEPEEKTSATEATEVAGAETLPENQQNNIADDSPIARVAERFESAFPADKTSNANIAEADDSAEENTSAPVIADAHSRSEESSPAGETLNAASSTAEETTRVDTTAAQTEAVQSGTSNSVEEAEETSETATAEATAGTETTAEATTETETTAESGEHAPQNLDDNTSSSAQDSNTEKAESETDRSEPHARLAVARPSTVATAETTTDTSAELAEESSHEAEASCTNTENSENTHANIADESDITTHNTDADTFTSAHDISLVTASLPEHVDDEWEEDTDTLVATPATNVRGTDLPEDAHGVDVAPSYNTPVEEVQPPSTTELAEGNLVLTEAQVVARLLKAQEQLFGENGTARDVSTVLIRVRALGSYYDALTHVRRNGFWDQQRTFDLIPEDVLAILQLKADSYKEGVGSPLAMSLRFTPGIPPVASFSYNDEGAFAKYQDTLPAQQYVEELRLFPRTGANIPEHMNRALASWTL